MKRAFGIAITALGFILLINPSFSLFDFSETIFYILFTYWPLGLIYIGMHLQSSSKKKRKS